MNAKPPAKARKSNVYNELQKGPVRTGPIVVSGNTAVFPVAFSGGIQGQGAATFTAIPGGNHTIFSLGIPFTARLLSQAQLMEVNPALPILTLQREAWDYC